jgi:homoserine O-acetyltransferase
MHRDFQSFHLGRVKLQSGSTLDATLVYKTYGVLNAAQDNVVLLPTFYTGTHYRNEGFFGAGRAIDPARHFIVSINLFGNGLSSSPSNTPPPHCGPQFPDVTLYDNVICQHRLITEHLGIRRIALVAGWSMAGCQAYHWGALYPDMVGAILPFCASAKTSPHNFVFLEGVKAALQADHTWNCGNYDQQPERGLRAFGRVYAGWAYSQTFFREGLYRKLGFNTIEELLSDWERDHLENWDANNLLAMLRTWQRGDISNNDLFDLNFPRALSAIRARAILISCRQDLYFPPEDNEIELRHMPNAILRVANSPWGHCAASPGNDSEFERLLDSSAAELLAA